MSIWELISDHFNIGYANVAELKERLIVDVEQSMTRSSENSPPFLERDDSDFIVNERRCDVVYDASTGPWLSNHGERFKIHLTPKTKDISTYRRESLAHELGHTYLYVYTKHLRPFVESQELFKPPDPAKELLVSELGRNIVAPRGWIYKEVSSRPSIGDLISASMTFDISSVQMAIRLIKDRFDDYKFDDRPYWSDVVIRITYKKYTNNKVRMLFGPLPSSPYTSVHDVFDKIFNSGTIPTSQNSFGNLKFEMIENIGSQEVIKHRIARSH